MKIVVLIARILLGLMFFVFGLNGFLNFIPAPPIGGLAGQFTGALMQSHYEWLVSSVEVIAGGLLLANLYVPLAIAMLAPVLANILVFHVTMMPEGIALGLVASVLWLIVAVRIRSHFAPLFARRTRPS